MRNLAKFFFTFDGRIPRKEWWLGQTPLFIASTLVTRYFDPTLFDLDAPIAPPNVTDTVIQSLLAVPTLALISKRFNDRGWPRSMLYLTALGTAAILFGPHLGVWLTPDSGSPGETIAILIAAAAIALLVIDNGVLRGQTGPNQHGPDPLAARAPDTP